jgi:hypothetical protein
MYIYKYIYVHVVYIPEYIYAPRRFTLIYMCLYKYLQVFRLRHRGRGKIIHIFVFQLNFYGYICTYVCVNDKFLMYIFVNM